MYFYPRSPCGERHRGLTVASNGATKFLSTLSLRRATGNKCCKGSNDSNFYPRSPCGERHPTQKRKAKANEFLSTLSLRRATKETGIKPYWNIISIHALLAESDKETGIKPYWNIISIHALLAESDVPGIRHIGKARIFLSTLSLRRATIVHALIFANTMLFLSTLSLRRATPKTHQ